MLFSVREEKRKRRKGKNEEIVEGSDLACNSIPLVAPVLLCDLQHVCVCV